MILILKQWKNMRSGKMHIIVKQNKAKSISFIVLLFQFQLSSCFFEPAKSIDKIPNEKNSYTQNNCDTIEYTIPDSVDIIDLFSIKPSMAQLMDLFDENSFSFKNVEYKYGNGEIEQDSIITINNLETFLQFHCYDGDLTLSNAQISTSDFTWGKLKIGMDTRTILDNFIDIKCSTLNAIIMTDISETIEVKLFFNQNKLEKIYIETN